MDKRPSASLQRSSYEATYPYPSKRLCLLSIYWGPIQRSGDKLRRHCGTGHRRDSGGHSDLTRRPSSTAGRGFVDILSRPAIYSWTNAPLRRFKGVHMKQRTLILLSVCVYFLFIGAPSNGQETNSAGIVGRVTDATQAGIQI